MLTVSDWVQLLLTLALVAATAFLARYSGSMSREMKQSTEAYKQQAEAFSNLGQTLKAISDDWMSVKKTRDDTLRRLIMPELKYNHRILADALPMKFRTDVWEVVKGESFVDPDDMQNLSELYEIYLPLSTRSVKP
ncbi:MAG: hypothetical protein M0031_02925 [Thermaerobacter sp.]|jgi:hypothetical protein|nr:hypothetical protein [Thermaerobacter sp.]